MAIDNTPPRLKLIVTIAVLTIVTLVSLDFVFKSYYAYMSDEAYREKLAPPTELNDQRKAEAAALTAAKIDQAAAQLGKGARADLITPTQSDDLGPMTGWSKLPKPTPQPRAKATLPADLAGDAGATLGTGDAGASATNAANKDANPAVKDAGAAPNAPPVPRAPVPGADAGALRH